MVNICMDIIKIEIGNLPIALMMLHNCCKGCETVAIIIQLRQTILLFPAGMISLQVAKATKCVLHFISHKKLSHFQRSLDET